MENLNLNDLPPMTEEDKAGVIKHCRFAIEKLKEWQPLPPNFTVISKRFEDLIADGNPDPRALVELAQEITLLSSLNDRTESN